MRAHLVTARNADKSQIAMRFAASEAEARVTRNAMMVDFGIPKKQVEIVGVEIPTNKSELLDWLNNAFKPFAGTVNG